MTPNTMRSQLAGFVKLDLCIPRVGTPPSNLAAIIDLGLARDRMDLRAFSPQAVAQVRAKVASCTCNQGSSHRITALSVRRVQGAHPNSSQDKRKLARWSSPFIRNSK